MAYPRVPAGVRLGSHHRDNAKGPVVSHRRSRRHGGRPEMSVSNFASSSSGEAEKNRAARVFRRPPASGVRRGTRGSKMKGNETGGTMSRPKTSKKPFTEPAWIVEGVNGEVCKGGSNPKPGKWWEVIVPGDPKPLQRPRFSRWGTYDPSHKAKKNFVQQCRDCLPKNPATGPVSIRLEFHLKRAKKHFSKREGLRSAAPTYPASIPDIDNLIKFVLDALNGHLYEDDRQIVEITSKKIYLPQPADHGFTRVGLLILDSDGSGDLEEEKIPET
ncbi:hypothetical protein AAMO2058_001522000 [Amorphochlora amoebiformis]